MSESEKKMTLYEAKKLALMWQEYLSPYCERIEIAGSIRREKAQVSDIELVAIPKPSVDIFNAERLVEPLPITNYLATQENNGVIGFIKNGLKYKQFSLNTLVNKPKVDLFLVVPPAQWGVIFTMRTGSADFSYMCVKSRQHGGWMPSNMRQSEGHLQWIKTGEVIDTPEEKDYFQAIRKEWVPPSQR